MGYCPVPASTQTICRYVAYLSKTLKYSSIRQYLNIIRIMHLEWDLPNPILDNFHINSVLRGARRSLGDVPNRKLPITPDILKVILSKLDISTPSDANMWAVCLILFFGLLRKGSVLPQTNGCLVSDKVLTRGNVIFYPWGMKINVCHTKTIQFKERSLDIPFPLCKGSLLCPVQATLHAFSLTPNVPNTHPAFCIKMGTRWLSTTGSQFAHRLKQCLSCFGKKASMYSGHSFRRGGATWAYHQGLPSETIRALGDWRSSAYLRYIEVDQSSIFQAIKKMQKPLKI